MSKKSAPAVSSASLAQEIVNDLFSPENVRDFWSDTVSMITEESHVISAVSSVCAELRAKRGDEPDEHLDEVEAAYAFGFAMGTKFGGAR